MPDTIPAPGADTPGASTGQLPAGSGPDLLSARYATAPRMSRARKISLGIVGLAILCGVVGYIGWQQANPPIQGTVVSFSASADSVAVVFEVDKTANSAATCTLQAEDVSGDVIGSATVQIPSGRAQNDVSYNLSTTQTANTVIVESCSLD
jgi:hypothetical protein